MRVRPGARPIQPAEIKQPGLFIPLPTRLSPEQTEALTWYAQTLGEMGLHGFDVDDDTPLPLLPCGPIESTNLGEVSYREVVRYFETPGLEGAHDVAAMWRKLRSTSARLQRDGEKWRAYEPFDTQRREIRASYARERQEWEVATDPEVKQALDDRMKALSQQLSTLARQTRRFQRGGASIPSEPETQPFIYVQATADEEARPLRPADNKRAESTWVADEQTALHLDHLYGYSRAVRGGARLLLGPDRRTTQGLTHLLNETIERRTAEQPS